MRKSCEIRCVFTPIMMGLLCAAAMWAPWNALAESEGEGTPPEMFTLTVNVTGDGLVFIIPFGGIYEAGSTVQLIASASFGWQFDHWEGNVANPTASSTSITMNQDEVVTLIFTQPSLEGEGSAEGEGEGAEGEGEGAALYTLTTATTGSGMLLVNPLLPNYAPGAVVSLSAFPMTGWAFDHWEGNVADPLARQTSITMNQNETVRAIFTPIDPEGEGIAEGEGVAEGEGIAEGEGVAEGEGIAEGEGVEEVTLNIIITGNGSVETTPSLITYPVGTTVDLHALPGEGWQFAYWEGNVADTGAAETEITLNQNETITAVFAENLVLLNIEIVGDGTVEKDPNAASYSPGATVTLTALPGPGYQFDRWEGNVDAPGNPLTALILNQNETVTVYFVEIPPEGEGTEEGIVEGSPEGTEEGIVEGSPEGTEEGIVEGSPEGTEEGIVEGSPEGTEEGIVEGSPEGTEEGTPEGGEDTHSADQNGDLSISLTELLRVIQFFNTGGFACADTPDATEDGYVPGAGANQGCSPHASDYNPQDWRISLTELLRLIQFFNSGGYHPCPGQSTEDGFCPGD